MPKMTKEVDEVSDHAPREASEDDPVNFVYRPKNRLPDPNPKPGFRFGWIRASNGRTGEADQSNWAEAMADGWRPVDSASVPELSGLKDEYSTGPFAKQGYIEHKGNVLCIIPEYKIAAREKYHLDQNRAKMRAIGSSGREFGSPELQITADIKTGRGPIRPRA